MGSGFHIGRKKRANGGKKKDSRKTGRHENVFSNDKKDNWRVFDALVQVERALSFGASEINDKVSSNVVHILVTWRKMSIPPTESLLQL